MIYLTEKHILIFLLQIFILLTSARIIGEAFRRRGFPPVVGEILVGILLGPTILGRFSPHIYSFIFPPDRIQQDMLETVSWLGIFFLLLATGFEVEISTVKRQVSPALKIGVVGVLVPLLLGILAFWWLPDYYLGEKATRMVFVLFLATSASISAISIMARLLYDLKILKTDLGLSIISAYTVNDILGWLIFTLVLGFAVKMRVEIHRVIGSILGVILFGGFSLTWGRKLVSRLALFIKEKELPHPATMLAFITVLGLFCGLVTQWMGIHAILGFFLAGVMVGSTPEITERTREIISQMIMAVFVPIFFATIGLKVDFLKNLDLFLIGVFTIIALGGKFIGALIGACWSKFSSFDSLSVGMAFLPGGAMEVVLGIVALEYQIITPSVFVAIVFSALFSSLLVGPALSWSLQRRKWIDISRLSLIHISEPTRPY